MPASVEQAAPVAARGPDADGRPESRTFGLGTVAHLKSGRPGPAPLGGLAPLRYKRLVSPPAPLTILHVAPGYWPMLGGGELLSTRLSEGLARRRHRVFVVNAPPWKVNWVRRPEHFPRPEGRDGVVLESPPGWARWEVWNERLQRWPIPGRGELRQGLRALHRRALRRLLLERVRTLRPDLLLLSSGNRFLSRVVGEVLDRASLPLLVVTQAHLDDARWSWAAVGPLWQRASALAVNTAHEGRAIAGQLGLPPEAVVVTGCGTEPGTEPAPWPRAEQVLYVGRLDPSKGIDHLLAALRLVWAERPQARLTIAGSRVEGSARVDAWIQALPEALRARVTCVCDISDEAKHLLLAQARVLVLPSRHESFGIVLLEAWAHTTPVITLDTPVARCIVRPGIDGLLTPPGDVPALAAALSDLLADPAQAERLGAAGRETLLATHTWDHVAERYETAVKRAVERHATAPG